MEGVQLSEMRKEGRGPLGPPSLGGVQALSAMTKLPPSSWQEEGSGGELVLFAYCLELPPELGATVLPLDGPGEGEREEPQQLLRGPGQCLGTVLRGEEEAHSAPRCRWALRDSCPPAHLTLNTTHERASCPHCHTRK